MVTIIDFKQRVNSEGKEYGVLVIQGAIETVRSQMEKPEALTTLRRNMINYLNIRSSDHLPCQSELARSGQGVRFFQ
jgi:hypothetical protein